MRAVKTLWRSRAMRGSTCRPASTRTPIRFPKYLRPPWADLPDEAATGRAADAARAAYGADALAGVSLAAGIADAYPGSALSV